MKHERVLTDGRGQSVRVVMEIDDSGPKLEAALARLANKARSCANGQATALDGAVRVTVTPVGTTTYQCSACGQQLTYDVALPAHRLSHQREGKPTCPGRLDPLTRQP